MRIPFYGTVNETNSDLIVGRIDIRNFSRKPLEGVFKKHLNILAAKGQWLRILLEFELRVPYKGKGGVGARATHWNACFLGMQRKLFIDWTRVQSIQQITSTFPHVPRKAHNAKH